MKLNQEPLELLASNTNTYYRVSIRVKPSLM
jgi:hypothetical protein